MAPNGFRRIVLAPEGAVEGPEVFHPAAGAWGEMGCTLVHLRQADEEQVGEALTLALQLQLTKRPSTSRPTPRSKTRVRTAAARTIRGRR